MSDRRSGGERLLQAVGPKEHASVAGWIRPVRRGWRSDEHIVLLGLLLLLTLMALGALLGRQLFLPAKLGLIAGFVGLCLLLGVLSTLLSMVLVRRWRLDFWPQDAALAALQDAALQDKDRLLQEMGRIAKIGGWEFDPRTQAGSWTEEVALIHEADPQAILDKTMGLHFSDGSHRERIDQAMQAAIQDGTPFDLELQIATARGTQKWIRCICRPVIEHGNVIKLKGTTQDITAQKQVENDLNHLNSLHNVLSELSQSISKISSEEALYQKVCRVIVDVGKFTGSIISVIQSSESSISIDASAGISDQHIALMNRLVLENEHCLQLHLRAKNGEMQIVADVFSDEKLRSLIPISQELSIRSTAMFPIKIFGQTIAILIVISARENTFNTKEISLFARITEAIENKLELLKEERNRKVAEQASRESQARFEAVFMHSPVGILLTSLEEGEIIAVNPVLLKILGCDESYLQGQTVAKLGFWKKTEQRNAFVNKLLRTRSVLQIEGKTDIQSSTQLQTPVRLSAVVIELADQKLILSTIEDLTHRDMAQEVSRKNSELEEQLHRIALTVPGIICSVHMDVNGKFSVPYVSRDLIDLCGFHYSDIGEDISALRNRMNHEDHDRIYRSVLESAQNLTIWHEEYRIIHPSKGEIWIEAHAVPRCVPDGGVLWHGFLHDVTERKRKEELLRQSEQRFRALFQHSPVAYQSLNEKACYIDVNERICQLLGYSRDDLIGARFVDFLVQSQHAAFGYSFEQFCRTGRGVVELSMQRRDGSVIEVVVEGQVQRDDQGRFLRMHCILSDITERRQAEQGLRLQSAALQAAANAIVITDSNGVVEWCNPAFTDFSGYLPQEAKGKLLGDLVWSGHQSRSFYKQMWETVISGRPWHGELVNRRKDGSTYHEQMSITPLLDEGKRITHFIAIKQDISNQKRLEAMLLRTQRLESIGRLASGIAHDLNNILTPMLMAPLMLRAVIDDPMALEVVDSIESSARRGAAIIKQLLTFSRGMPGNRIPVRLRSIVREMTKLITQTFPKNISLHTELERDTWPILGDPVQIHQVLLNLCVNARDAMPQGGVLTLSVEQVVVADSIARLHGVSAGNFAVMFVQDTGIGIATDDLDRIYDPFFTTKPIGEGTGLGLSTALGIVKSHQGFIQVESQLGKGTSFRIHFPAFESAASPIVTISSEVHPLGRGELILVVDDEELTRQMVQQVLEQHGYHVLLARNGTEALALICAHGELRLVLSDAMMPGMDGPQLLQRAKQQGVQAEFLIMTGLQSHPELQDVMRRYGVSVLDKPFSAATLLKSVQRVLHHKSEPGLSEL